LPGHHSRDNYAFLFTADELENHLLIDPTTVTRYGTRSAIDPITAVARPKKLSAAIERKASNTEESSLPFGQLIVVGFLLSEKFYPQSETSTPSVKP
jgi:hypothetical protein